jgi:hypothetical protein
MPSRKQLFAIIAVAAVVVAVAVVAMTTQKPASIATSPTPLITSSPSTAPSGSSTDTPTPTQTAPTQTGATETSPSTVAVSPAATENPAGSATLPPSSTSPSSVPANQPTNSPAPTASPTSPPASPTPSPTVSASPSASPTVAPTGTPTPSLVPSSSPSASLTPTSTPQTTTPPPTVSPLPSGTLTPGTSQYIVLAWNDLGMHCYNPAFSNICVLPPFNNLEAQVLRKSGEDSRLVTTGITVQYFFPNNTYSAGKTDFWTYANQTFNTSLATNIGLTGKGLSGIMDLVGTHFEARGIPLTEYTDQAPTVRQPFQQAIVVVTNSATGAELCRTLTVAPVSTEMRCDTCHGDAGIATTRYPITPTNNTDTNILMLHDYLHPQTPSLMNSRPVLCGSCHSDNALGAAGKTGVPSLSNAMHSNHNNASIPIANTTSGCYSCHPGPTTQCYRDVMSQMQGFQCENCHGGLAQVASNPNPWLNEPRCDNPACHGSNATLGLAMTNPLYRMSTGMGGVYCEGCHDSTHAIAPSKVAADGIKFVALQGNPGELRTCTVCHGTQPDDPFFHNARINNTTNTAPPLYSSPTFLVAILAVVFVLAGLVVFRRRQHRIPLFSFL